MQSATSNLSSEFLRLYADPTLLAGFSRLHPISFARVLPFESQDVVLDERHLLEAEEAHLARQETATRLGLIDAYSKAGLLEFSEATHLRSAVDFYDADFFELMGLVYANAGMFKSALRWYRELIRTFETERPPLRSDEESVYASAGYCLYALGLFEEAIAWSKSCIGPRTAGEAICRAVIGYEVEGCGGAVRMTERAGSRVRFTISSNDPGPDSQSVPRLKAALASLAPFSQVYIDWTGHETVFPAAEQALFEAELDTGGTLMRHKLNLVFSSCWLADALVEQGFNREAQRVLQEAAMIEPAAAIVSDRLKRFGARC